MLDDQRKALVDAQALNGNAPSTAYEVMVGEPMVDDRVVDDRVEEAQVEGLDEDDGWEDQGAADIEFIPTQKVKIRIDIDRLNWADFLTFETLSQDASDPENMAKIIAMCRRCVVYPDDPMSLPLSTFRPVIEAITNGIQGRSNRKNSKPRS